MARSTNAQKTERLNAAHRLLAGGTRVADAAALLADECGISLRHAYRYIEEAQALRRPVPIPVASIHHVQDFRRHHRTSASLLCKHRNYIERDCDACNKSVSRLCKQEWLSAANGRLLMSIVTTSSIVCSFTNCNKRR